MKKLIFEKPVSESQLQKIILESIKELGCKGQWYFEHGFSYDSSSSYTINEKVNGNISVSDSPQDIAEFKAYAWTEDYFQEPMFAGIEFRPPFGSEEGTKLFEDNIDKIYASFQKKYQAHKN